MDERLQVLTEQILRYRELLALAYAQKDAIQKGDLSEVGSLLAARQELIDRIQEVGQTLAAADRPPGADADVVTDVAPDTAPDVALPDDGARETERRLLFEAAMLLEKLLSLDKENERLLEVKLAAARGFGRTGYAHTDRNR